MSQTTLRHPQLAAVLAHPHLRRDGDNVNDLAAYSMCGTERLWKFVPLLVTVLGYVGVRILDGSYRVRVVPAAGARERLDAYFQFPWKNPSDGETRYSNVPESAGDLADDLRRAFTALLSGADRVMLDNSNAQVALGINVNEILSDALGVPTVPLQAAQAVLSYDDMHEVELVAEVQRRKLAGCNAAKGWKKATLVAKLKGNDAAK